MELFYRMLPEIPAGLIFMRGKRLYAKGFRWAPATWMLGSRMEQPNPLSTNKASPFPKGDSIIQTCSVLTDRGLLVRYPGYYLYQTGNRDGIHWNSDGNSTVAPLVSCRHTS